MMDDLISLHEHTMLLLALEVLDTLHCATVLACNNNRIENNNTGS